MRKYGLPVIVGMVAALAGVVLAPLSTSAATHAPPGVIVAARSAGLVGLKVGTVLHGPARGPKGQKIKAYQWKLCNAQGARCAKIKGATHRNYRVVKADLRHTLRLSMIVTSGNGTTTVTTVPTPVIVPALPVNTALPTISGVAAVGQLLTGTQGTWTNAVAFTYQWQDCDVNGANCVNIAGATTLTYLIQQSDVGDTIRLVVTGYNYQPS